MLFNDIWMMFQCCVLSATSKLSKIDSKITQTLQIVFFSSPFSLNTRERIASIAQRKFAIYYPYYNIVQYMNAFAVANYYYELCPSVSEEP